MAVIVILPDPDIMMQDGPWDVGTFCIAPFANSGQAPIPSAAPLLTPALGSFRGGTPVRVSGGQLDLSACADDFADGVVDAALWTVITAGTGAVSEDATSQSVILDTGATAGSSAGLRSIEVVDDVDVEATFELESFVRPNREPTLTFAELALSDPVGGTEIRVFVTFSGGARRLEATGRSNNAPVIDLQTIVARTTAARTRVTLRILRAGSSLVIYRNGIEVLNFPWLSGQLRIEMIARNDLTLATRVITHLQQYRRRPVIRFGGVAARDVRQIDASRVVLTAPAVPCVTELVDVIIAGCALVQTTVARAFTYTREADLIRFVDRNSELVVCNDERLTKRRAQ